MRSGFRTRQEMLRRRALLLVPLLLAGSALLLSQKPRVGIACTAGQAACTDPRTAVFCGAGAYRSCDQSVAVAGDGCVRVGFACTKDKGDELSCRDGEFVRVQSCGGPFGCRIAPFDGFAPGESGNVLCDNDIAREGDPCLDEGDYACTSDRREALRCVGQRLVFSEWCDGAGRCRIRHPTSKDTRLDCDTSGEEDAGGDASGD